MKSVWFRPEHYKDEKKKNDYEAAIKNSRILVDRLLEILDLKLEAVDRIEYDPKTYDAGYVFYQAFLNGRRKEIEEIKDLLNFENKGD